MAAQPRFTIPTRIVLGYAIVLLAFGGVAGFSFFQHSRTAQTLGLLQEGYLPLALTLGQAKATQSVYANLVDRVLENERSAPTQAWLKAALRIRPTTLRRAYEGVDQAEALARKAGDPAALDSVRKELDAIGEAYSELDAKYDALFAALNEDSYSEDADKQDSGNDDLNKQDSGKGGKPDSGNVESGKAETLLAELQRTEQNIERNYDRASQFVQRQISRTSNVAAEQEKQATLLLALLGLLALVVGVAVTWASQRLLRPIPLLHERVAAVARGDLSSAVNVKRDDELGKLVAEFERMVQALAARDQRLREAALAEQRLQRMQVQIVEALSAAVVVVDAQRVIRTVNPAAEEILDISPRDVGASVDAISLLRRFPALAGALAQVAKGGDAVVLEGATITGFAERLVDVLVTPFGDEGQTGDVRGVLVVADDVTESVATKSRLIQTERLAAIGRMAAHVTHEVRNPLSSIGLNVDMLSEELQSAPEESRKLVTSIQQELDRLESITEEYLRLARLPEPALSPEDPSDFLRSIAEFVRREMDAAGVELKLDIRSPLPRVAMDEPQLRQALLNLLRNAREAMPDGGAAKLEAMRYDGGVRVQVHDEGAGVGDEELERVFDLFYTTKQRGTGLGLPLTQQIVVAHGGHIACKARHPRGTTFEVWLPAAAAAGRVSSVRRVG